MNGDPYVVFLCVSPCVYMCVYMSIVTRMCEFLAGGAEVPLPGPRLQSVPSCISIQQMIPSSVSIY